MTLTNYRGGSSAKLQIFLVASTCVMYLVAAGLFARAIWYFEQQHWNKMVGKDVSELGAGPGSYDISRSVWHVNVRISAELATDNMLIFYSVAVPKLMVEVAGVSLMEYLDGRIPQPTAPSYRTTSTGLPSPLHSSQCGIVK